MRVWLTRDRSRRVCSYGVRVCMCVCVCVRVCVRTSGPRVSLRQHTGRGPEPPPPLRRTGGSYPPLPLPTHGTRETHKHPHGHMHTHGQHSPPTRAPPASSPHLAQARLTPTPEAVIRHSPPPKETETPTHPPTHTHARTQASNIRSRRGRKVDVRVPIFRDTNTPGFRAGVAKNGDRGGCVVWRGGGARWLCGWCR
jgi:hypothetical protein